MKKATRKEVVKAPGIPSLKLPFSWGIKFGNLLFLAGQGPLGKDGKVIRGGIKEQTRQTLENIKKVVEAAGSSMENIVQTTIFLKDLKDYAGMNEAYAKYFKKPYPARATVGVSDLLFGMKVEIQGIAAIPEK